jgi:hypothetical protein
VDASAQAFGGTLSTWQSDCVKARFDDHVITVTEITLPDGHVLPEGTHGFVIEAFQSPETYEIEFDHEGELILATVQGDAFGVA